MRGMEGMNQGWLSGSNKWVDRAPVIGQTANGGDQIRGLSPGPAEGRYHEVSSVQVNWVWNACGTVR